MVAHKIYYPTWRPRQLLVLIVRLGPHRSVNTTDDSSQSLLTNNKKRQIISDLSFFVRSYQ